MQREFQVLASSCACLGQSHMSSSLGQHGVLGEARDGGMGSSLLAGAGLSVLAVSCVGWDLTTQGPSRL